MLTPRIFTYFFCSVHIKLHLWHLLGLCIYIADVFGDLNRCRLFSVAATALVSSDEERAQSSVPRQSTGVYPAVRLCVGCSCSCTVFTCFRFYFCSVWFNTNSNWISPVCEHKIEPPKVGEWNPILRVVKKTPRG